MSTGFGRWYEEKKAEDNEDLEGGWFPEEMSSFLNAEAISFSSMKASMEAQMPRKIMGMGYQQRFQVFCGLLLLSALFFALAFFVGLPTMALKPQKFAIAFTMGSLTFMGSFGILKGPAEHLQSMIQRDRLWFTTVYFLSMFMTLYSTKMHGPKGYIMVICCSASQLVALLWYLVSFLPGGAAGLSYVGAAVMHLLKPVLMACARCQAACLARCAGWMVSSATSSSS